MGTKGRILLHLAAALAGWGIVQWQDPAPSDAEQPIASGKSSIREARDREAGEKLLRRLVPDLAPAPPLDVKRHGQWGTLEERVFANLGHSNLIGPLPTPDDDIIADYLRDQIRATLHGRRGPDLAYAFFHGRLEANQVLDSLRRTFPDLAGEPQFPRAVFQELFLIEPARAVVLTRDLPPGDHGSWISDPLLDADRVPSAPGSLVLLDLQLADAATTNSFPIIQELADSAELYYSTYGDDYTAWLLDQPPTPARRVMLETWAAHLRDADPSAAAALERRLSTR